MPVASREVLRGDNRHTHAAITFHKQYFAVVVSKECSFYHLVDKKPIVLESYLLP